MQGKCPYCKQPVVLQMLELGLCYRCLDCHRIYHMPVLGLCPEEIFCVEGTRERTLRFLRVQAYEEACRKIDDYGRSIETGRFTKWPSRRRYGHLGWEKAKELAEIEKSG